MQCAAYCACKPALQLNSKYLCFCKLRRPVIYMYNVFAMLLEHVQSACRLCWPGFTVVMAGGLTSDHPYEVSMLTVLISSAPVEQQSP